MGEVKQEHGMDRNERPRGVGERDKSDERHRPYQRPAAGEREVRERQDELINTGV